MRNILRQATATLGAFVFFLAAAISWDAATAFSGDDFLFLPEEPFESTAQIDTQTTVFLYLGEAADASLRRIYVERNNAIRAAFIESAGSDAFKRCLEEERERETAKRKEIEEAAALEHDAAFRKIEAESKTPEERTERLELFYDNLGVSLEGTGAGGLASARRKAIAGEAERYLRKIWPLRPEERVRLRVAQETWRLIESKIWPELSVDWENLNLDGARFDFRPEVFYDLDAAGRGFEKFGGWRWGIPATLEQLSQTKSWRDKTLRDVDFYRVFADASFAGWTLENCRFWADECGQGTAFDAASKAPGVGRETRRPGELWQGTKAKSDEDANGGAAVGYDACDFTDATLKNVLFDRSATITFAQFAATRSFKEDEIDAEFRFPLDGWDFAGKNVDALRTVAALAETEEEEAEKSAVDESERVVYLYLKDAQSEKAQEIWNAWSEKVRAAKAENGARFDAFFFYEHERSPKAPVKATWSSEYLEILERAWTRVFDGTVETLAAAKIDVDWECLNLDGATISEAPRRCVSVSAGDEPEPYGDVKCGLFYDEIGNVEIEYGIRTSLADLRRTVNWSEKRLSDANFERACFDESFAGWTLTKCNFDALLHGGLGGDERSKEWLSRNPDGCKRADFTDATLDRCSFDRNAAITFEQFASTRSYREDKICVYFGFPLDGWDFSGKNVGNLKSHYAIDFSGLTRRAKLADARFEPSAKNYPKGLPEKVWLNSRACKEKDLAGASFYSTLGGGDFSGFDLTGATMRGVRVKNLDGATIRGLRVVGTDRGNSERELIEFRRQREYGKITKETLCATKSWRDKDLRDVEFNWFYDLTGVDFSGCDLRGATFRFAKGNDNELEKAPFFANVDFTDANIDGCKFYVFAKEGERSWPTLEQIMSTETWKSGDLERLKTCVLPDEAQKIVDRRIFEASPEFAAKDFSGKEIKFRDMSGWDLSGLNLTGCKIVTCSLWDANLTGAILDGATLRQDYAPTANATTERLHRKPFLNLEQLAETDNYRRKSFRDFALWANVRDGRFSFAGLDLTNASFTAQLGGFDAKKWASRDFTDAEVEGGDMLAYMTKEQLLATKTFKEGRLDYEAVDKIRWSKERVGDELRAEYERLQAEKANDVENAPESPESDAKPTETGDAASTRIFYLYGTSSQTGENNDAASNEPNWEALSLDGATISEYPTETFDEDVGEETGVPATLEQLRRTKTWREKTAREVVFNASLAGESFVGWTFERCEFGGRWNGATRCDFSGCDFADAMFDDVYFGAPAITFERFAASRSFKEDEIVAEFAFPLAGWNFAGKNVSNIEVPSWDGAKLDGARLDPPRTTNRWAWGRAAVGANKGPRDAAPRWPKVVPETLWRETEAFKNKDLSGTFFWPSLNGGDFAGFDLTDAFLLDGPGEDFNLDGATIRGFKIRERSDVTKQPFFGAIPASAVYRTKSWQDKDLRGVCFGVYFDLKDADFSGCDLRGAVFTTPVDGADFTGADLRDAKFRWRAFYDSYEDKPLKKPEFGKKGANFSGADLRGADFRNADGAASRSNFDGAKIDETTLGLAERLAEKEKAQRKLEQRVKSPLSGAVAKLERDATSESEAFGKGRVVTRLGERSATFVADELTDAATNRRWRDSEAFKNKRLSGACFATSLNAGDFSGFDLTGAIARRVDGKPFDLRGATIRGLWVVDAEGENAENGKGETSPERPTSNPCGRIKPTDLIATKSWAIKDLREIWFNRFFDLRGADFLLADLRGAVFETSLEGAYLLGAKIDGCKFSRRAFGANVDATISALTQTETWRDLERMKTVEFSPSVRERVERRLGGETKRPAVESDWGDADWEGEENADANAADATDRFRAPGDFSTFAFTCQEPKFEVRRPVSVYRARSDADWVGSKYFVDKCLRSVAFEAWLGGGDFSGFDLTGAAILDGVYEDFRIDGATIRGLWILGAEKPENKIWLGSISPDELRSTQSWKIKDLRGVCFNEFFDLRGVDFAGRDLSETLWTTALQGVKFGGCDLNGAFFAVGVDADADAFADAEIENCVFAARKPTFEQLTQTRTFRDGRLDYDAFDDAERLRAEYERLQASKNNDLSGEEVSAGAASRAAKNSASAATK